MPLDYLVGEFEQRSGDLLALDVALEKLDKMDPELVEIVGLRFFGGQSVADIARLRGRSLRSTERAINAAKAWLRRELQ